MLPFIYNPVWISGVSGLLIFLPPQELNGAMMSGGLIEKHRRGPSVLYVCTAIAAKRNISHPHARFIE